MTLQDIFEIDSWADINYQSPYVSLIQAELAQLYHEKLKGKFFYIFIGSDFLRITVFSRVEETVKKIQEIIGDDYVCKSAGYFSNNILITVKP